MFTFSHPHVNVNMAFDLLRRRPRQNGKKSLSVYDNSLFGRRWRRNPKERPR